MGNNILNNIWSELKSNKLTESDFDTWSSNFKDNEEVQANVHNYLKDNKLTNSDFDVWKQNIVGEPEITKTNAVVEPVATATAKQQTATNTVSTSEDTSLGSQEPDPKNKKVERYINYIVDGGEEVLLFESDYLEQTKKDKKALSFDDYAKSKSVNIVEAIAAPVIKAKSRESFILEQFNENAYKKPLEVSGFGKNGTQELINNNSEVIEKIASKIDGINYFNQNDENLNNLDVFAKNNADKTIVVYSEGEDDTSYKESYDNIKNLKTEVEKLTTIIGSGKATNLTQVKQLRKLEKQLDNSYEDHMRKFKTLRSNVEFITAKNLSKKRFESKGDEIADKLIQNNDQRKIVDDYDYYGKIYLSPKEKQINALYEKQKITTGEELNKVNKQIELLKKDLGKELYDPLTGKLYNLQTAPKEVIESYDRSEKLAANTDVDLLKNLSFKKQTQLIGAANDLYESLKNSDYLSKRGGFGASIKASLSTLENIVKSNKLPVNLRELEGVLSDSLWEDGFHNFAPELGDKFNKTLKEYLEINRALKTNTNILTSEEKNYFEELVDSTVNKFGFDIDTKRETKDLVADVLIEAGFNEEDVNKLNKNNKLNIGQTILRGTPDLVEFVGELYLTRGMTGNSLAKLGRYSKELITKAYEGNKFVTLGANTIIPAVVEGGEFALNTAIINQLKDEDESISQSGLAGFSMGFGGKLTRGFFGELSNLVGKTSIPNKMYNYSVFRGIGDSKVMKGAYNNFTSASGGAGAFISGNILLNPIEYDYSEVGRTYLEEGAKMFLLGKFQNAMKSPYGSVRRVYENYESDILSFSNLNSTSYKASKILNVETDKIKNPNETSNKIVEDAWNVETSKVTKQLLKKEVTQEEADLKYEQINRAKEALEVQIGINQAKSTVKQSIKEGSSVSEGDRYVIGKKIIKNGIKDLTTQELDKLSLTSPESILLSSGIEINGKNIEFANKMIDVSSMMQAIVNGNGFYISSLKGEQVSTGTNYKSEFKVPNEKLKKDVYDFLIRRSEVAFKLENLRKQNKTEENKEKLDAAIKLAENEYKLYSVNGKTYENLQSKLRGATLSEINKDYNRFVIENGREPNVKRMNSTEEFVKAGGKRGVTAQFTGGEVLVDMEIASKIKDITVIPHEETHFIFKDILKDDKGNVTDEGIKIIDTLLDSLDVKDSESIREEVEKRYNEDGKLNKSKYYEENLTVFVEHVRKNKITKDKALTDKLLDIFPLLKRNRFKNLEIDINTGEGLFVLLEGFAKGDKQAIEAAYEFAGKQDQLKSSGKTFESKISDIEIKIDELTERYYDGEIDDIDYEQQLDNLQSKLEVAKKQEVSKPVEVKKTKPVESEIKTDQLGDAINKIIPKGTTKKQYDNEVIGKVAEKLVSGKTLDPLIKKIATGYGIVSDNVYGKSWEDFYDAVKGVQLLKNLQKFNPETNDDFGGFVIGSQFGIRNRVKEALEQFKKENEGGFKEDVETAKDIISEETDIDEEIVQEKTLIDPRKSRIVKDKLADIESAIDVDPTSITTLTFKNVTEKFGSIAGAKIFNIPLKKVADATANLTYATKIIDGVPEYSEAGNIQNAFTNPQQAKEFIRLLPEFNVAGNEVAVSETGEIIDVSESAKGYAVGVPNNLLKLMYDTYVDPRSTSDSKTERSKAITSPKGRSKGLTSQATVYRLKPEFIGGISNEAVTKFQDMLGITEKGKLNKYDREIGQVLKSVAKLYGSEVANIIVRDKINKSDIKTSKPKSQVLADIAAGKSSVMFSKDVNKIEKEANKILESIPEQFKEIVEEFLPKYIKEGKKIDYKGFLLEIQNISKEHISDSNRRELETAISNIQPNKQETLNIVKIISEFRDILIKEYEALGNKFNYDYLLEDFSEAKTEEDKIKLLSNFFADNTRSGKTRGFDDITTNRQVFEKVGKLIGKEVLKSLGFTVGTRKKVNGEEISWIEHKDKGVYGMTDITYVKRSGFDGKIPGGKTMYDLVVKDSNIAITRTLQIINRLKNRLKEGSITKEDFDTEIEAFLRYNKIDQRGLVRKISTPGFQIKTNLNKNKFKTTELYLEHKTSADQILDVLRNYANNPEANQNDVVTKLQQSKVNIIPKYMADMLPKYKKGIPNEDSYKNEDFKKELEKYINEDLVVEFGEAVKYEPTNRYSKGLSDEFNRILENKTGIKADTTISEVKAKMIADNKRRFELFIPPSAEDFVGLLYYTLGKGKVGDEQMKFYKRTLLDPYARANQAISRDRNALGRRFKEIKKEFKVTPKDLKKRTPDGLFTREQAVRVWIWNSIGAEIPGLSKSDVKELVDYVNSDKNLSEFAVQVMQLNPGKRYLSPTNTWNTGTITTDLLEVLNTSRRAMHLKQWQQNVDAIFSDDNLNKLEAAYGTQYRKAMENILTRMKTGRNRAYGTDALTGRVTDWVNGSVGAIMFLNTRSAILQTISATNFINFTDNNILAAGKALANQKQYWSDFSTLFKSEYLIDRRDGLKVNVNEADIADIAKEKGVRGALNYLLKLGFTPTQIADSFAIASGGATFYRNRIKSLIKKGMDPVAAEKLAMRDFIETAEESQQSSRPDKISQQQAGPLGRIVLAFANTPAQYARLIKKAASDLKNGRGDAKTNISKILYYGAVQNIIFNTLQQAVFAMTFGDDEEEEDKKKVDIINSMIDGIARGTGLGGAVFTVVKNTALKLYRESEKKNPKYEDGFLELLKISPPISSKIQKVRSAGRTMSWEMEEIKEQGLSLGNPAVEAGSKTVSALFNFPADRAVQKINNLVDASNSELETYKRLALLGGWSAWELGIKEEKPTKPKKRTSKTRLRSISTRKTIIR